MMQRGGFYCGGAFVGVVLFLYVEYVNYIICNRILAYQEAGMKKPISVDVLKNSTDHPKTRDVQLKDRKEVKDGIVETGDLLRGFKGGKLKGDFPVSFKGGIVKTGDLLGGGNIFYGNKTALLRYLYWFVAHTPPGRVQREPPAKGVVLKCNKRPEPRKIAIAILFSSEVDVLEIALAEYYGLADVYLFENQAIHHQKETSTKPLIWPILKESPRFQVYKSAVVYHECKHKGGKRGLWDVESRTGECMNEAMHAVASRYDIVVVGSVDEILSRSNYGELKYCETIPRLPCSSAIGMPLGKLGRTFRTDWHVPDQPYSFSVPTVYDAKDAKIRFVRSLVPVKTPAIVGGLHATNYCYLPELILKQLTATEYPNAFSVREMCKNGNCQNQASVL